MNVYYKVGTDLYFNAQKVTISKQVNAPDIAIISLNYDTGLEIPAASSITIYVDNEVYFRGIYESSDNGSINVISNLGLLNTITMGAEVFESTSTPIDDIATIFSATYGSALTFTGESSQSIDYVWTHQSLLEALGIISEITNESWYQSGSTAITWIGLPENFVFSEVVLTDNVDPLHAARNPKLGFITDLTTQVEVSSPVNLIYAFGSEGVSLNESSLWPDGTTIVGNNPYGGFTIDQTNSSVKKDSITITQHIRKDYLDTPPTITDPDDAGYAAAIVVSANTLLKRAMAEIELREEGTKNYFVVGSAGSILDLYPTQIVHVKYTGATAYLSCNVVSIDHIFDLDSGYSFNIRASTSYRPKLSLNEDQNVLIGMSKQIKALEKTSAVRRRFDVSAIPDPLPITQVKALDSSGLLLTDDGSNGIFVADGGNIGIGTTSPTTTLHLKVTDSATTFRAETANDAGTFNQVFTKARGTTASPTIVAVNDYITIFNFYAYDGTQNKRSAYIAAQVSQTPSTNNVGGKLVFSVGSNPERTALNLLYTGNAEFNYDVDIAGTLTVDGDTTFNGSISEAWQTPTLGSGWSNWAAGYSTAGYRRTGSMVHLRGFLKYTTGAATTIFTLAAGYRPTGTILMDVYRHPDVAVARVTLYATGAVNLNSTLDNLDGITLDGISFFTD